MNCGPHWPYLISQNSPLCDKPAVFIFVSAWEPGLGKPRTRTKKNHTYKGLWEYRRNPAIWVSLWIYLRLYLTLKRMFWLDRCWFITWEQKHTGETDMPLGSWGVLNYIQDVHCEFFFWCFKRFMSGWCKPCIFTISWEHWKCFSTCRMNAKTLCSISGEFMNSVLHSKLFTAVHLYLQLSCKCVL